MTTEQLKLTGDRVRIAREARGWSQEDLAREAGVAPNTVGSIETGKKKPWAKNLRAVLDALDLASFEDEAVLDLTGVPSDVRTFLRSVVNRMSAMDEDARDRLLLQLYPKIIEADPFAEGMAAYRRGRDQVEVAADTPLEVNPAVTRKQRGR